MSAGGNGVAVGVGVEVGIGVRVGDGGVVGVFSGFSATGKKTSTVGVIPAPIIPAGKLATITTAKAATKTIVPTNLNLPIVAKRIAAAIVP